MRIERKCAVVLLLAAPLGVGSMGCEPSAPDQGDSSSGQAGEGNEGGQAGNDGMGGMGQGGHGAQGGSGGMGMGGNGGMGMGGSGGMGMGGSGGMGTGGSGGMGMGGSGGMGMGGSGGMGMGGSGGMGMGGGGMADVCGDGAISGSEACDDQNSAAGDGCAPDCTIEAGYACAGEPSACADVDECADGSAGCSADASCSNSQGSFSCACDPGFTGDGFACADVDECADGSAGCSADASCSNSQGSFSCACDPGFTGDGFTCAVPVCGNGTVEPPAEACDDGNHIAGDGCRPDCMGLEVCGDGRVDYLSEECDDGDDIDPGDGCHMCLLPAIADVPAQKLNGALACSISQSNSGRKISSDGLGNFYVMMNCGGEAYVVTSGDQGQTWSAPLSIGIAGVAEAAVEGGRAGVAYVAAKSSAGELWFTRSTDGGATWAAPHLLATSLSDNEVSIDSLNGSVYVEVRGSNGELMMFRSDQGGEDASWASASLAQLNIFHDVIADKVSGAIISAADNPTFRIRISADGGATFGPESNPPGQAYFSDWSGSRGLLFVVGNFGSLDINVIPVSAPGTSVQVSGLPSTGLGPFRAVDADPLGNAYVASRRNAGGIQLDRMAFQSGVIDPADARLIWPAGSSPGVAGLPNSKGALVVFQDGTDVYAAVEVY